MVAMRPEMEFTKLSYLAISPDGEKWQPMNPNAIVVPTGDSIGTDSYFELYCRPLTRLNAAGDLQYEPLFLEDLDLSAAKFFHCAAEGHSLRRPQNRFCSAGRDSPPFVASFSPYSSGRLDFPVQPVVQERKFRRATISRSQHGRLERWRYQGRHF